MTLGATLNIFHLSVGKNGSDADQPAILFVPSPRTTL